MNTEDMQAGSADVSLPILSLSRENGFFALDPKECARVGAAHHDNYIINQPFPHMVFDNFLESGIFQQVLQEFPQRETGRYSDSYSRLKTGYTLGQIKSAYIHDLLNALNSAAFLVFLENMTGIRGLIDDAHFAGGGLHETARGGHLSIHADFNIHPRSHLRRRLNLILFLNENWDASYGGSLELWDRQMKACRKSILPVIGRAVIFNTDTTSYHGHPDPLTCPDNIYRRSIALYYYTAPPQARVVRHSTLFRPRAGTEDARLPLKQRMLDRFYRTFSRPH